MSRIEKALLCKAKSIIKGDVYITRNKRKGFLIHTEFGNIRINKQDIQNGVKKGKLIIS